MREEYPLYVKWRYIVGYILDISGKFPRSLRFNLADRLTNEGLDVLEYIVEAIYSRRKRPILDRANLSIEKIRALLHLAVERQCLSVHQWEHISSEINEAGAMVGGWIKSCGE